MQFMKDFIPDFKTKYGKFEFIFSRKAIYETQFAMLSK